MSDGEFQVPEKQDFGAFLEETRAFINRLKIKSMTGIEKIAQKRLEQKIKHGHSIKSDYEAYPDFELIQAAQGVLNGNPEQMPKSWDQASCKKLCSKPLEDRLIAAGAMLAAQIDVLNFSE